MHSSQTGHFSSDHPTPKIDRDHRRFFSAAAIIAALIGVACATAFLMNAGSKTGMALAVAMVLAPIAVYLALARPVVFPFALYAALVPFDSILNINHFGTLTKLLAITSGAALVFWMIRHKRIVQPPRVLTAWVALLVWMAITLFWAIDSTQAYALYFTFVQLSLLYIVVALFPVGVFDFWILIIATVLGATIAAAYGAYLFHSGIGLDNQRLFIQSDTGTISPNHFAASLILPTALLTMGALRTRLSLWKIIQAALALLLVAGIYFGASRAGFFALGVMLVFFFWKTRYRVQIALLGLAAISMSFVLNSAIWTRFSQVGINGGSGRVDIWRVGLEAVKQYWLTGAGVGGFPAAFDQAFLSVYQPFYTHWHRAPHNLFLESLVELGLIGLVVMLAAWLGQFRMLDNIGKDDRYFDLRIAVQGAILGLFVSSLFADIMFIKYTWFAFCIAALVRSVWIERQLRDSEFQRERDVHLKEYRGVVEPVPITKGEKLNVG